MSLLNDSFKKLKSLLGDAEAAQLQAQAQAQAAASAHAAGGAGLRSEMRKRRRLDMRERLAEMIQPDGSVAGGIVRFISLYPIAAAVGERWPLLFPKVEMMSESVIRRDVEEDDLWLVQGDQGFAIIFTKKGLSDLDADDRCFRIFEHIREYLLGKKLVAIPRFDVDPRLLLRALDEGGAPPLHLAAVQPKGVWMPPATELAKREQFMPPDALAAYVPGPGLGDIALPSTRDAVAPEHDVPTSHERPILDPKTDWHSGPDRTGHDPDWGETQDRVESGLPQVTGWRPLDEDFELLGTRRRIPIDADFVPVAGETKDETLARYVTMGRFNTLFDAIDLDFRSFWSVKQEVIGTFLADPRLREPPPRAEQVGLGPLYGGPVLGQQLVERAEAVNALAALDIAVLRRVIEAVVPRLQAGAQFFFAIPVAYPTLLRKGDRHAYFDIWAAVPEDIRRFGRFWCYQSTSDIGDLALGEVVAMLDRASRVPIFAALPDARVIDRLRQIRVHAVAFDGNELIHPDEREALLERLKAGCTAAAKAGVASFIERVDRPARKYATLSGAGTIEGPRLSDGKQLPDRPRQISADRFAKGG